MSYDNFLLILKMYKSPLKLFKYHFSRSWIIKKIHQWKKCQWKSAGTFQSILNSKRDLVFSEFPLEKYFYNIDHIGFCVARNSFPSKTTMKSQVRFMSLAVLKQWTSFQLGAKTIPRYPSNILRCSMGWQNMERDNWIKVSKSRKKTVGSNCWIISKFPFSSA